MLSVLDFVPSSYFFDLSVSIRLVLVCRTVWPNRCVSHNRSQFIREFILESRAHRANTGWPKAQGFDPGVIDGVVNGYFSLILIVGVGCICTSSSPGDITVIATPKLLYRFVPSGVHSEAQYSSG